MRCVPAAQRETAILNCTDRYGAVRLDRRDSRGLPETCKRRDWRIRDPTWRKRDPTWRKSDEIGEKKNFVGDFFFMSPVPSHEAWLEWCPAQDVPSQAKVQAGEVRAAGSIVEHVHSVALLDCIWSQLEREGFQSAEEHQGEAQVPCPSWEYEGSRLGTPPCSVLKEQLRPGVPQEAVTRQINVSSEVDGLCLGRIVWLRSHEDNSILQAYSVLYIMLYTMVYNLLYMLIRTCRFLPRKQWLSQSNG